MQALSATDPVAVLYLPEPQSTQALSATDPVAVLYLPFAHASQGVPELPSRPFVEDQRP